MSIESVFIESASAFKVHMSNKKLHGAFADANFLMKSMVNRYSSHREIIEAEKAGFDIIYKALTDEQLAPCYKAEKFGWSIHACLGDTLVMWNSQNKGRMHIHPDGSFKRDS